MTTHFNSVCYLNCELWNATAKYIGQVIYNILVGALNTNIFRTNELIFVSFNVEKTSVSIVKKTTQFLFSGRSLSFMIKELELSSSCLMNFQSIV